MSLLEFRQVGLTFQRGNQRTEALRDINVRIQEGEFVTIVGPSGCGKSSLLKLAAGVGSPTSGEVKFAGHYAGNSQARRVMMFQDAVLLPWLSVENNIGFGLKLAGAAPKERSRVVRPYMEKMDLLPFANHRPYELSGGMKQRASLARTLAVDPDLVLMDEPFAALDAFTKRKLQELVAELWRTTGKTFLFITHDIDEALLLGTRLLVMASRPGVIVGEFHLNREKPVHSESNEAERHELKRKIYGLISG